MKWIRAISAYSQKNLTRLPLQHFCELDSEAVNHVRGLRSSLFIYVRDWIIDKIQGIAPQHSKQPAGFLEPYWALLLVYCKATPRVHNVMYVHVCAYN